MDSEKKKEEFNPSSRKTPIRSLLPEDELDFVNRTIQEYAVAFANRQEKEHMIIIMGIIRKKLKEDPMFAKKLRDFLGLENYLKASRKVTKLTIRDLEEDVRAEISTKDQAASYEGES